MLRPCCGVNRFASAMLCASCVAVRLIKTIRRKNPEVQLLLFSATYNDKVKEFAMRIAPNANQVCCNETCRWFGRRRSMLLLSIVSAEACSLVAKLCSSAAVRSALLSIGMPLACKFHCPPWLMLCCAVSCCPAQVFVPKEELSLDVISQYNVL